MADRGRGRRSRGGAARKGRVKTQAQAAPRPSGQAPTQPQEEAAAAAAEISPLPPEMDRGHQRQADVSSGTRNPAPHAVRESPEPIRERPEAVRERPEPVRESPEPIRERPEPVRERPEAVRERPEAVRERPEPIRERPEAVRERPGAAASQEVVDPMVPVGEMTALGLGGARARAVGQHGQVHVRKDRYNVYYDGEYKPTHVLNKQGNSGTEIMLRGNFFKLTYQQDWEIHQYHVDFIPAVEGRKVRIGLLFSHGHVIGSIRAFDGTILYLPIRLISDEVILRSVRTRDNTAIKLIIKYRCKLAPRCTTTLHVLNIIWRRILQLMGMTQISRYYFDKNSALKVDKHGLKVIPGFQTSILQYEEDILLQVDVAHKILRTNTVLDVMKSIFNQNPGEKAFSIAVREIVGSIVLTTYNDKTYLIDDIAWEKFPTDTFDMLDGNTKTFVDYYRMNYNVDIKDTDQPLLISKPKRQDIRRGQVDFIYLLPELCLITGLTEKARSDFHLMQDIAIHTRVNPEGRVSRLVNFMKAATTKDTVVAELSSWKLKLDANLAGIRGRQLPAEKLSMLRDGRSVELSFSQEEAAWSQEMKGRSMRLSITLRNWLVLHPPNLRHLAGNLITALSKVAAPIGMKIMVPQQVVLTSDSMDSYLTSLQQCVNKDVQMVVCVLPNTKKDRYDAIKKLCCISCPVILIYPPLPPQEATEHLSVPSQMVTAQTLSKERQLMSIATKIAIQMNCKMGGVVWAVHIPLKNTMIVGIDTYHDSSVKGRSCGGVVATTTGDFTRYFSTVTFQTSHQELLDSLTVSMTSCLLAFQKEQKTLPSRVIIYRDGVGDGQLDTVYDHEIPQIKSAFEKCTEKKIDLIFFVVKKRINARFFQDTVQPSARGRVKNPPPGTIIDSVATKPSWFDFFLISQSVRQGTVSPTHYNVINQDSPSLRPGHLQQLTYKLTHMYYNWQGTVRVPAPCMYAHKLAFLCGQSLHKEFSVALADKLFFL